MIALNYLYFLIITIAGLFFLFRSNEIYMRSSPFVKGVKVPYSGLEVLWVLTFSTGLLALSAPGIFDLMAIRLLILEAFCFLGLFLANRRPVWGAVATIYFLYLIWLLIGLYYTSDKAFGIRVFLKYIYPFLILLFSSAVVWNESIFMKAGIGARAVACISVIVTSLPFSQILFPGVFWYGTALAIHYIAMCVFSLALFYHTRKKKSNLIWAVLFALPCLIWVFRTSIMGTTAALMMFFFFRYKLKSLPVIFGVFALAVASVFFIPSIRDKMFKQGKEFTMDDFYEGEISMDDVETSYREFMWKWAINNYYKGHEVVGNGTGALQKEFYTNPLFNAGGNRGIVHNDYVQILCDNGIVGLVFYLGASLFIVGHSFVIYNRKRGHPVLKICAITAGASMFGMLFTLYADNVVNYSMATLAYPWGFYGMLLGLNRRYNLK